MRLAQNKPGSGIELAQKYGRDKPINMDPYPLPLDILHRVLITFALIVGIDVGYKIQAEVAKVLGVKLTVHSKFMSGERICTLSHWLFHEGRLGRKTGIFDIQCLNQYSLAPTSVVGKMLGLYRLN